MTDLPTNTATASSEPLGTPQRLAGIELQLSVLNTQLRGVLRWVKVREALGVVLKLVWIFLAVGGALALWRFTDQLKDSPLFGGGEGGTSILDWQKQLQGMPGFGLPDTTLPKD